MPETTLIERTSLDRRYLWNAEACFADREAWNRELEACKAAIPLVAAGAGSVAAGGAKGLFKLYAELLGLLDRIGPLYVYASMSQAVDVRDLAAQAMNGQAGALFAQFSAAVSFVEPELLALGKPTLDAWMAQEPGLAEYAHTFDNLFRKQAHVRSAEVEEVLGLVSEVFQSAWNTRDLLVDADLKFAAASDGSEVAQSSIDSLLGRPEREVRRSGWHSYCDAHIAHENSLSAALATAVKRDAFIAKARRFGSSIEAALFENDIPRAVFDSTIATFRENLPVWHRYWRARRKALGLEKLEHFDIWAPLAKVQPKVPYEKAVGWIAEALSPLGSEYSSTLRRGCLEERWVDVYPTIGKGQGAFSTGWKGISPFIMMSYSDDLSSMSTLAHELGHSMHSWHTWRTQPSMYADYSIFVAEVASNFNQAMTRAYLFEREKDPQFQLALIEEAMDNLHRYFFIMPTLARFELEMHSRVEAGKGVTADDLNALMADLFAEGYGGELEVDRHREGSTWAQFGHLYMNYYVFQYATGISAAHALAGPILAGEAGAAGRYREFLSAGSSVYPVEALRRAGVDMRGPEAVERCFGVLEDYVARLEGLIGK